MKTCSRCGTQYTDDTLQFCLQDGTPLGASRSPDKLTSEAGETETVVRPENRVVVPLETHRYSAPNDQPAHVPAPRSPTVKWALIGVLTAVFILLAIAIGIGSYLIYSREPAVTDLKPANTNKGGGPRDTPAQATPTPSATRTRPTPVLSPTSPSTPSPDTEKAGSEALQTLHSWSSMLEARDLSGYMGHYANRVDYYKGKGVSSATVRADKARALQLFDSMKFDISNESTTVSPDGGKASVTYDKEWHFSGRSSSEGKTRSQVEFTKINGRWLITAERDLQLYYKR